MRVAQISILARVYGNVNADEVIGQRITIKKMYSSEGEVYPFISARAIKRCIRDALATRDYSIDPFSLEGKRLVDIGDPKKYVDDDLFGFMRAPRGKREVALRRQGPVAISYFKALKDTPIKSELGLRAPRPEKSVKEIKKKEKALLPFEIEVADFIGRLNILIYDYIGKYIGTEGKKAQPGKEFIEPKEREERLEDFLEILLTPGYILPKRTNSLNVPEYFASLVSLSGNPYPIYQYLDYVLDEGGKVKVDMEKLKVVLAREEIAKNTRMFLIDYGKAVPEDCPITVQTLDKTIEQIVHHIIVEKGTK